MGGVVVDVRVQFYYLEYLLILLTSGIAYYIAMGISVWVEGSGELILYL